MIREMIRGLFVLFCLWSFFVVVFAVCFYFRPLPGTGWEAPFMFALVPMAFIGLPAVHTFQNWIEKK